MRVRKGRIINRKDRKEHKKEINDDWGDLFLKDIFYCIEPSVWLLISSRFGKELSVQNFVGYLNFDLSLRSLRCNSLAPTRLAPSDLPSAFDPAAATPHVFLRLIILLADFLTRIGFNPDISWWIVVKRGAKAMYTKQTKEVDAVAVCFILSKSKFETNVVGMDFPQVVIDFP